ncbi:hypothetical protein [Nostoc sp. DedQUE07]|uniref:hypothetical protein n=1 Tax=Nostoc sp. DedQUE07 TaxID=3075392 RepID=UPI002AD3C570|nr:hypothetical protein [Nostoc sp. DedQUE07]
MLNTKENFNQLDVTLAVKELGNEAAATIQGGFDLIAYDGFNGKGSVLGEFNFGKSVLGAGNNRISSVRINAGRWKFSDGFFGLGESETISRTGLFNFRSLNNRISSLKRF